MRDKEAGRGNVLWMNCEGQGQAKRMNRGEPVRALRRVCALLSVFVCAFILFAAIPVSAHSTIHKAESNHQFTLEIYGNANEDDTIDMRDVTYIKLVIFGKKPETKFCDANYDGRISMLDVVQTKLIIVRKEGKLTIVDGANRTVTVNKPINRVVCTFDQQIEALRVLKVSKDKIVGVPEGTSLDTDFFPEFGDVRSIGTSWEPDLEAIIELNPDLVFLHTSRAFGDTQGAAQKFLEAAGITVLRFAFKENYPDAIKKLGYVFDKEEEAKEFLDWYTNILNTVKDRTEGIPDEDKPKVYAEGSTKYKVSDRDDWAIALAGGKDIFAGKNGAIDVEEVIAYDPDIIIKPTWEAGGYGLDAGDTAGLKAVRDEIMGRPELQNVKAVKEGRVYVITTHLWTYMPKTGNRHFIGICYMAKWFHPELFKDLDPKAIHQEYITRFQGLDIDLDEKGVFVYPEPS